jgi:protein disulfide-isomerase A6
MLAAQLIALTLSLAPSLVSAGMFPADSLVKMLDAKTFKGALKANQTSLVAFVAPWCGHCQKMVPEYSKAALGLYPLVPVYAVNCHAEKNKRLCAEQGVQGFPTVKMFPRGSSEPPVLYEPAERTASNFFYFVTRGIPKAYTKLYQVDDIPGWIRDNTQKHRALLLSKDKKVPLLWQVLANKYSGTDLAFASHRDRKGKSSVEMGFEMGGPKEPKVLLYPIGSDTPTHYQGIHKLDSLSKFFDSVLEGTANLTQIIEEAKAEEFVVDEKDLEIEKKQEAQRIALLHGGYTDLIDFEKAIKNGGADYHDSNGYGGMMGGIPEHFKKGAPETQAPETPSMSAGVPPITTAPIPTPEVQAPLKDEL